MPFSPTTFVNNQAPAISASQLNKLGTQYDQALNDAPDTVATQIRNPESDVQAAVLEVTGGQLPAKGVYPIVTDNPNLPRPTDIPDGWIEYWFLISSDPNARPVNAGPGAVVDIIDEELGPWTPAQLTNLQGWYTGASINPTTDGSALTSWNDISGLTRTFAPHSGTGLTTVPQNSKNSFGTGHDGVLFPQYSGLRATIGVTPASAHVVGIIVKPVVTTTSAADEMFLTFSASSSNYGRYSISRSGDDTKIQIASGIDTPTTVYQSPTLDFTNPLRLIAVRTATKTQLYVNGVNRIDQTETGITLAATTTVNLGFLTTSATANSRKALLDGRIGSWFWGTPPASDIDSTLIANMDAYLQTQMA